jgi:quercetin dioxygenase-like cupin family protein
MADTVRLRQHPQERFDAPAHHLDLAGIAQRLREEAHPAVSGHRQIAIYKHAQATLVLYVFEQDGEIPEHDAEGVVTIHVLTGKLVVHVAGEAHAVASGQVLALAPGIPHSVRATEPGEMLLTVHFVGS